jgi:hypothetical protein
MSSTPELPPNAPDEDPYINLMPHVEPTSRFENLNWMGWDGELYDPKWAQSFQITFWAGALYVHRCLYLEANPVVLNLYGQNTTMLLSTWSPAITGDTSKIEEDIKEASSVFATFHSGAIYMIEKLRVHMEDMHEKEGFGECLDDLEKDVHRQFTGRLAVWMAEEAKQDYRAEQLVEEMRIRNMMADMEAESDAEVEDGAGATSNGGEADAVSVTDGKASASDGGGKDEEPVADSKTSASHGVGTNEASVADSKASTRARYRARSRKAKKLKKSGKVKDGKTTGCENGEGDGKDVAGDSSI